MNDINGSADFGNKADICMIVDRNDEMEVTTVYVDKVRFKHLGHRGFCHMHYEVMNGRFNPCDIGKSMNHDGEVIDRYNNVLWQVMPWIAGDGTLSPPSLTGENEPSQCKVKQTTNVSQQTLLFS